MSTLPGNVSALRENAEPRPAIKSSLPATRVIQMFDFKQATVLPFLTLMEVRS